MTENKKYEFVGWVPCVNGHLDFGLSKVGIKGGFTSPEHKDLAVIEENLSANSLPDHHARKIVLQSWVDWRDTELDNEDEGIGRFRLFVCGEVNESQNMDERYLTATVLIYPLEAEPQDLEAKTKMRLHDLSHGLNQDNINQRFAELKSLLEQGENIAELKSDCLKASFDIKVEPNGLMFLDYIDSSSKLDQESSFIIARQVYYYIKYSLHSHRHHIDEQDSLTTITKNTEGAGLRLLSQLKRELTTLSRIAKFDNSTHPTNNSLGIVAYSKSLVVACQQSELLDSDKSRTELDRLCSVKESFSALDGSIKHNETKTELISSKAKVWLGFSLIFLWGISNFLFESATGKVSIEQPIVVPVAVFILALTTYHLFTSYYKIKHNPEKIKNIYYLEKRSVSIKIVIALLLLITLGWLGKTKEPATYLLHSILETESEKKNKATAL